MNMANQGMNLVELAERANLSPRSVRFYIHRGLLPPPTGAGRGRHYNDEHLRVLVRLLSLQSSGHSLEAIGRIFAGEAVESPEAIARSKVRSRSPGPATLWTRLSAMTGVELHFDATRHQPDVAQLAALAEAIRSVFENENHEEASDE